MDAGSTKRFLPSKRVLAFAGILAVVGVVYLLSGSGFVRAINVFSSDTKQTANQATGTQSSFLANQNPPESGSIVEGDIATVTEQDNITERAANSVAPRALALAAARENGEDISDQDIARVASSMSANIEISDPETFQKRDISQYETNSQKNIQTYANELTEIMSNEMNQNTSSGPLEIMSNYAQSSNANLSQLDEFIRKNDSLITDLKEMTVPPKYSNLHIELLNSISLAKNSLKKMKQTADDPTVSIIGIQKYRQASNQGLGISTQIGNQISNDL